MAVVGAGYIAVEIAGVLNALGTETHLLVRHDKPLRSFDPVLSDTLVQQMARDGLTLHPHSEVQSVEKTATGALKLSLKNGASLTVDCLNLGHWPRPGD